MADRHYQVLVDDYDIDETELHNPIGQSDIVLFLLLLVLVGV